MNSNDSTAAPADYAIGYGRPPVGVRFQPGQSGNPLGRPRGARDLAGIVAAALDEKIMVNENGRLRSITKLAAAVKQLVNRAAAGETRVTKLLLSMVRADEAILARTGDEFDTETDAEVLAGLVRRLNESR